MQSACDVFAGEQFLQGRVGVHNRQFLCEAGTIGTIGT